MGNAGEDSEMAISDLSGTERERSVGGGRRGLRGEICVTYTGSCRRGGMREKIVRCP